MTDLSFPSDRRYHDGHLWAKEGANSEWIIGVTDFAQQQLGEVIYVNLPAVGQHFDQGQSCADIESVKVVSDAVMPLSGTVTAVNETLADVPGILNADPYGAGWLLCIRADNPLEPTLDAAAYQALISD